MNSTQLLNKLLNEGKVWDKVKKVWRDHKGAIIIGGALAASLGTKAAIKGKQIHDDNKESAANDAVNKAFPDESNWLTKKKAENRKRAGLPPLQK